MAKLILTHDVPNLGVAGDVVIVKDGYARNYLIPRHLGVRWTVGAQKEIDRVAALRRRKEIASVDDARAVRDQLQEVKFFPISKRASNTEALYGAVSSADVAASVKETTGVEVDRRRVVIEKAIKSLGDHFVTINLHPEVSARIKVRVLKA